MVPSLSEYLIHAFKIGLHFDVVIICYFLLLPLILLFIISFSRKEIKIINRTVSIFVIFLFILSFLIFAIDIPWFNYNFSRINVAVFNWVETPGQMLGLAVSEISYLLFFAGFILFSVIFSLLIKVLRTKILEGKNEELLSRRFSYSRNVIWFIIIAYPFFLGMRGNIKAPLKIVDACVSNNATLNQIGLNPVFTFIKSFKNKINVLDPQEAIKNTKEYFSISENSGFDSPVARKVDADSVIGRYNLVLVLMESMSADNLTRFGNNENITPHIDSLAKYGISFDNIWSAGKHTSNGIFSTLYSFPGIWSQPPTSNVERALFSGLPGELQNLGYRNWFFTTHDLSYDNLREFLFPNGMDTAIEVYTYPKEDVVGMYGVPDHVMFARGIKELNEFWMQRKPFFATFVTTSNHGPYVIPNGIDFKAKQGSVDRQAVEYSDWAIGYFMKNASQQVWFDSTIFVFVADHGANLGNNKFDIPLSFHHIPFIIYCPKIKTQPESYKKLGGQIDVFPTVMHLFGNSYVNNTFGINLFEENRPYIYFTEDNKMVCLNDTYMYVFSKDKSEQLFLLNNPNEGNELGRERLKADDMKKYLFSMLQTSQWMIERKLAGVILNKKQM